MFLLDCAAAHVQGAAAPMLLKQQVICKAAAFAFEMSDAKGCFDMACPLETW